MLAWRNVSLRLPVLAGPVAMAAFLLPWLQGPGPLASERYSGLGLIQLLGALAEAEPTPAGTAIFMVLRCLVLGVAVSAVWLTLLAPRLRWHWGYRAAAGYMVVATGILLVHALASTRGNPLPGAWVMAAATLFVLAPAAGVTRGFHLPRRLRIGRPVAAAS